MISPNSLLDRPINVRANIERIIAPFHVAEHSTVSFDYCFNYFQSFADNHRQRDLASAKHKHMSCLQIGWFLANWGMLRGKSFLRTYSITHFEPLIDYIANCDERLWHIDVDSYTDENIRRVVESKKKIQHILGIDGKHNVTDTLATKIMLAVFGSIPAFDRYFQQGFKMNGCTEKHLQTLHQLYLLHRSAFESAKVFTFDITTKKLSTRPYPKARLMDIVGFVEGGGSEMAIEENRSQVHG